MNSAEYLAPTPPMLQELNLLYRSIEERRGEMLTYLEAMTDERQNKNPTPTEWSPLQVMEHIVIVEEYVASPLPPADNKVLLKGHLFMTFGVGLMRTGLRIPTIPQAVPSNALDFAAVRQRWSDARNCLLSKLKTVAQENQAAPIAPHPIAGPLTAKQTLELLDAHLIYHLRHFPHSK